MNPEVRRAVHRHPNPHPRPNPHPNPRPLRRQRGASMTEFIIISPIALLLMLGILQFGLIYMAKLSLNNATFLAARHGANVHADISEINSSLTKGLIPFYINSAAGKPDAARMATAWVKSKADGLLFTKVELISPSKEAFQSFGLEVDGKRKIPNDNLEYRLADAANTRAGPGGLSISIRDANLLKIKVTYGYELKVPLIRTIMRKVMCLGVAGGGSVQAWKASNPLGFDAGHCAYYTFNRIPLVAYATVHMQSDAIEGASSTGGSGGTGSPETPPPVTPPPETPPPVTPTPVTPPPDDGPPTCPGPTNVV